MKYLLYVNKKNYIKFSIIKKNGSYRIISSPIRELKSIQRKLLNFLSTIYDFSECQHGFVKGKSIVTNANRHLGANYLLNIDLKDFFDTINFGRVRGLFLGHPFNFNNEVATIFAKIVCDDNKLPQGAPTSPIIANIICYILDNNLKKYCDRYNCKYTRYADDISISSRSYKFPRQIAKKDSNKSIILGERIIKIIEEEAGFIINREKVKLSGKMQRQEVTGLIINEKVNIKRVYIRNLRAMLHNCRENGIEEEAKKYFKNSKHSKEILVYKYKRVIEGKLNFLKMVKSEYDPTFLKYAKEYNDIIGEERFNVDKIKEIREYIEERTGVIYSEEEISQGTIQFIEEYGALTSTHILVNKDCLGEDKWKSLNQKSYEFPLKIEDIPYLFYYKLINEKEKAIPFADITQNNIENDIMKINIKNKKNFKINCNSINIGEKVTIAGYGEFNGFDKSSIIIENAEVIAERRLYGINVKCINKPIYHGMSGGPVLNKNREAIGIIFCGGDFNEGISNGFIPFSDIIGNI